MKIAFTDIETTGLDPKIHEIIDIGVILFDSETCITSGALNLRVAPEHPESGDSRAYALNGYTEEEWQGAASLTDQLRIYAEKTDGAVFCAHNSSFDLSFLKAAAQRTGIDLPILNNPLDNLSIAKKKIPGLSSYSLKNLCHHLGIEPEAPIHRAINGAMKGYEIYKKLHAPKENQKYLPVKMFLRIVRRENDNVEHALLVARDDRGGEYIFLYEDYNENMRDLTVSEFSLQSDIL